MYFACINGIPSPGTGRLPVLHNAACMHPELQNMKPQLSEILAVDPNQDEQEMETSLHHLLFINLHLFAIRDIFE